MFLAFFLLACLQLSSIQTKNDFEIPYTVALSSFTLAENVEKAAVPEVTVKPIRSSTTLVTTVSKAEKPEHDLTGKLYSKKPKMVAMEKPKETIATHAITPKSFISTTAVETVVPDQDSAITKRGLAKLLILKHRLLLNLKKP